MPWPFTKSKTPLGDKERRIIQQVEERLSALEHEWGEQYKDAVWLREYTRSVNIIALPSDDHDKSNILKTEKKEYMNFWSNPSAFTNDKSNISLT